MKKVLLPLIVGLLVLTLTACKQPGKAKAFAAEKQKNTDNIVKNIYADDEFGDDDNMEVLINNTKNTATIHLNGETFLLKKNLDLPYYTAEDAEYRYSDIKGDITFLRRDFNMVLFHCEKQKSTHLISR